MEVDLGRRLYCCTAQQPGMVLLISTAKSALLVKLSEPREEGLEAALKRMMGKRTDSVAECMEGGKNVRLSSGSGCQRLPWRISDAFQKDLWLSQGITRQPGREGKLLALAEEAGQGMWSKQLLKVVS